MVLLVLKCHMALWHKWHKLMQLVTFFSIKWGRMIGPVSFGMTSSQPMSRPWCVWGVSIIFSSVSMSLGSAKYDTYVL